MKKEDITIVVLLFAVLFAWFYFQRPDPAQIAAARQAAQSTVTNAVEQATNSVAVSTNAAVAAPANVEPAAAEPAVIRPPLAETNVQAVPQIPEQRVTLTGEVATVTISSYGGTVVSAELKDYPAMQKPGSPPIRLDFEEFPALSLSGVQGLARDSVFQISAGPDGRSATLSCEAPGGLNLERTLTLLENYRIEVVDSFRNAGDSDLLLPEYQVSLGPMRMLETKASVKGMIFLDINTLPDQGGAKVEVWGKKLNSMFGLKGSFMGCGRQSFDVARMSVTQRVDHAVTWAAVMNKYFVQILAPDDDVGAADCEIRAERNPALPDMLEIESVSASLVFSPRTLKPGETFEKRFSYYAGPKRFSVLQTLGKRQDEVMLYAWWNWFREICRALLWTLNAIYKVIPNYGVAIILLTVIVKVLFWPVTHKSNQSMKEMQKLQPLVSEIRAKFKDNPTKMNQEVMALYKEHKVNPMAGCLPMAVQIPVFIALFNVLRSAIELRYASFLWISDLSEPEGLLAGLLPIPLNILPLFMTATTYLQQKLTPTSGDPQQQKMMMFMPIFMLFLFYSMASGLVLYWSVSQVLAIAQLWLQKRRTQHEEAALHASSLPVPEPPRKKKV